MALHDGVMVLRQAQAETGMHPGDLIVEFRTATLVAGTVEVPTMFADGQIVAVFAMQNANPTVNQSVAFDTDKVVSTGAITVSGPTGSTETVTVMIIGRAQV